jgi:hypothetical protein
MKIDGRKCAGVVLRLLGLKRAAPKTRLGRVLRGCEHAVCVLGLIYIFFHLFPQRIFAHSVQAHGIRLYSTETIPGNFETLLSEIRSTVVGSPLYGDEQEFSMFMCNSKLVYALFAPVSRGFAIAVPATQNIFVADADLISNQSRKSRGDHNMRSFTGVASHEMGHVLLERQFGFWTYRMTPKWLNEGYCEMIAGESSFPETKGDSMLAEGRSGNSASFQYFTY